MKTLPALAIVKVILIVTWMYGHALLLYTAVQFLIPSSPTHILV